MDRAGNASSLTNMLALQRTVGNRIASSLMHRDTPRPGGDSGSPLDGAVRSAMESRFAHDLSSVRIHSGKDDQRRAMAEDAAAFTTGADIYFGPQRYKPRERAGQQLIAHELVHVLQQSRGDGVPRISSPSALEHEAASLARTHTDPGRPGVQGGTRFGTLQTDKAGENDLHFRGQRGERGIGVFYVKNWESLSKAERADILAWCREVDFYYSRGVARVKPSKSARAQGRSATALARKSPAMNLPKGVHAGHTPDKSGGGHPLGPLTGLPGQFNMSIGGQLQRYKRGFIFTGLSLYDHDTGKWLHHSLALEHEPPPTTPGPPKRPRHSARQRRRNVGRKQTGRQATQQRAGGPAQGAPAARQVRAKRSKQGGQTSADATHRKSRQEQQAAAARARRVRRATTTRANQANQQQGKAAPTQQPPLVPPKPPVGKATKQTPPPSPKVAPAPDTSTAPPPHTPPKVTIDEPQPPALKVNAKAVLRKAPKMAAFGRQVVGNLKGAAAGMAIDLITSWIKSKGAQLQIERGVQDQMKALEPRFEELLATSPKQIHAKVRVTMWTVTTEKLTQQGVEEREGFPNVLVSVALVTEPVEAVTETPVPEQYWGGSIQWSYATYSFLLLDVEKERRRQEVEREDEKLRENLRKLAAREKKRASKKKKKPVEEWRPPPPGSATGWFAPAPQTTPLLPYPGGVAPENKEAEGLVGARKLATKLLARAKKMAREGDTPEQREDFKLKVDVWLGGVERMMREFSDQRVVGDLRNLYYEFKERLASTMGTL